MSMLNYQVLYIVDSINCCFKKWLFPLTINCWQFLANPGTAKYVNLNVCILKTKKLVSTAMIIGMDTGLFWIQQVHLIFFFFYFYPFSNLHQKCLETFTAFFHWRVVNIWMKFEGNKAIYNKCIKSKGDCRKLVSCQMPQC